MDRLCTTTDSRPQHATFALICAISELTTSIRQGLLHSHLQVDQGAPVALVLDAPTGFAMRVLEQRYVADRRLVVVTWNHCPEYWDDLWDQQIHVLIAEGASLHTIAGAMQYAAQPDAPRLPSRSVSALTVVERRILSLLARGYANQEIAHRLVLSHQTVRNSLTTIYEKIHVKSRSEAILYYWGVGSWAADYGAPGPFPPIQPGPTS